MKKLCLNLPLLLIFFLGLSIAVSGQARPDPVAVIAAQREAMALLAGLDGVWRGPAWSILPNGEKRELTQTERVGPFLDGSVKVIEGRGYDAAGKVAFNAFGTISYNPANKTYTLHSYAQGNVGDFVLKVTVDGYVWEIPAGPMMIRYTAVIKNGTWHEIGERIMPDKEPVRIAELNLKRIGNTTWPAGDAVPQK